MLVCLVVCFRNCAIILGCVCVCVCIFASFRCYLLQLGTWIECKGMCLLTCSKSNFPSVVIFIFCCAMCYVRMSMLISFGFPSNVAR